MNKKEICWTIGFSMIDVALALIPFVVLGYVNSQSKKAYELKKQIYEIADTNHKLLFEDEELYQLGKGLELIAKDEVLSIKEIEKRINNTDSPERFQTYIDNYKKGKSFSF